MSKLSPPPNDRPGGPTAFQTDATGMPPEPETDFANEHDDTSYANDQSGGLEGARESESPQGHAGMD